MANQPRVFHISPEGCGDQVLTALFEANDHKVATAPPGALAEDLSWAMASGQAPLQPWPEARLFTGLWRLTPWWRPPLESWRAVAFLRRHFPDAVFVLTRPDMDQWLLARMTDQDGLAARAYAHHLQVDESDLPDIWARGLRDHIAAAQALLAGTDALIQIDMTAQTPHELAAQLHRWVPLPHRPSAADWGAADQLSIEQRLGQIVERLPPDPPGRDADFVEDVARFCLKGLQPRGEEVGGLSGLAVRWTGGAEVCGPQGQPRPIRVIAQPDHCHDIALAAPGSAVKHRRAEGVINDLLRRGRRDQVLIDMEDSRWLGSPQDARIDQPVLCHNRRRGARNVVLYPLPGQHGPGFSGFEPSGSRDTIAYEDKLDRLVWRGMISGSERRPGIRPGPASHVFLRRLALAGDDPVAREAAWQGLCRTSRMAVVRRFWDDSDYDMQIVMAWGFREFARDPLLAPYCGPRQPPSFLYRYRYQLCMAGYDHGSNFIPAINSNSVLLKEEDGWEVYYSGRFQPWRHYIPVSRYCDDLPEKLAWARRHPDRCKAMSERARAEVRLLSDPVMAAEIKTRIFDGLAAALRGTT